MGEKLDSSQSGRRSAWIISFGLIGAGSDGYLVRVEANARALADLGFDVTILEVSERAGRATLWENVKVYPAWPTGLPKRGIQGVFDVGAELRGQLALVVGLFRSWRELRSVDLVVIEGGMLAIAFAMRLFGRRRGQIFVFDLHTKMSSLHRDPAGSCTFQCKLRRLVWSILEFVCIHSSHLTITCGQEDALLLSARRTCVIPHTSLTVSFRDEPDEDPSLIGFVGSGRLGPNRRAVGFITADLLDHPRLESVRCRVIGDRSGYDQIGMSRMEFVGFSEDLVGALAPISVCCAPMTQTGGVSTKVLAYLMSGKRTVCTAEAARGIALPPSGLWIAGLAQFADAVASALAHPWPAANAQLMRDWMAAHHGLPVAREAWRRALTHEIRASDSTISA